MRSIFIKERAMEESVEKRVHKVSIDKRSHMDISGVCEVISFDEECVLLKTSCGEMSVEGSGIKIGVLDTDRGVVSLDGKIDALFYSDEREKGRGGLFGRLGK